MSTPQQRAIQWAVAVACLLLLAKLLAYWMSGSVALLSSLIDSAVDLVASAVNMFAIRQAMVPPDQDHRFGHGKAEGLGAMAQAAFISGSALLLLVEAGQRLFRPQPLEHESVAVGVMLLSIVASAALVLYQRRVARQTGSLLVQADSLHYLGDLLANAGVVVAIVISSRTAATWVDPVFALLAGFIVLRSAVQVGRKAIDQLMDRELGEEVRAEVLRVAMAVDGVLGVHDLRTRAAGPTSFVQLHLEIDGHLSLHQAHAIADAADAALREAFPDADILIHQDPVQAVSSGS